MNSYICMSLYNYQFFGYVNPYRCIWVRSWNNSNALCHPILTWHYYKCVTKWVDIVHRYIAGIALFYLICNHAKVSSMRHAQAQQQPFVPIAHCNVGCLRSAQLIMLIIEWCMLISFHVKLNSHAICHVIIINLFFSFISGWKMRMTGH